MSIARKLVLLAGMALAALALTASTASAENRPVEVINEHIEDPAQDNCAPCTIHAAGEATISTSVGGAPVSRCLDEFAGTINHNALGEVRWTGGPHGAPGCTVTNCAELAEQHWPILGGHEEAGREFVIVEFCLRGTTPIDLHCTAEVPIVHIGNHDYTLSLTNHPCAGGAFFVTGAWQLESDPHDEIEIVHVTG
jgi:hypothetical protein